MTVHRFKVWMQVLKFGDPFSSDNVNDGASFSDHRCFSNLTNMRNNFLNLDIKVNVGSTLREALVLVSFHKYLLKLINVRELVASVWNF